ncbi:hypothetical protein P9D26_19830 [Bacillus velezensis]|uniref:hypothetical protein n=1 Tax=Bacillus velezensis TaxID=492670 RepID=UPI002DBF47E0|nr:hypothetical protein [Bacillus velezensis]MEC1395563.1 hypothetical protein [Bacillus velezensis]
MNSFNKEDIKVLEKIYKNRDKYEWTILTEEDDDEIWGGIDFPTEAENKGHVLLVKLKNNFYVLTGTYQTRFYYEEEKYSWDKKTFVSFVIYNNSHPNSIAFITDEDYQKDLRDKDQFHFQLPFSSSKPNIVEEIYKSANRIAYDIPSIYDDILNEDD